MQKNFNQSNKLLNTVFLETLYKIRNVKNAMVTEGVNDNILDKVCLELHERKYFVFNCTEMLFLQ